MLDELRRIKTKEKVLSFLLLNKQLKPIGEGTGRIVFNYDIDKVIKLAKNEAGRRQNQTECSIIDYDDICASICGHGKNYDWLIMERVDIADKYDFFKFTKLDINYFFWHLEWKHWEFLEPNHSSYVNALNEVNTRINCNKNPKFVDRVTELILSNRLSAGDISRVTSWGKRKDGSIVLFDYGLAVETWRDCYSVRFEDVVIGNETLKKRIVEAII